MLHNRYRPVAPSGENAVVDQESAALRDAGHQVRLVQRHSAEIEGWSRARRATVPMQMLWSGQSRRLLADELVDFAPDVVHVHNTFPIAHSGECCTPVPPQGFRWWRPCTTSSWPVPTASCSATAHPATTASGAAGCRGCVMGATGPRARPRLPWRWRPGCMPEPGGSWSRPMSSSPRHSETGWPRWAFRRNAASSSTTSSPRPRTWGRNRTTPSVAPPSPSSAGWTRPRGRRS